MNQDFLIPATPGMARNVLRLSKICDLRLDPDLGEYAEQGAITPEEFEAAGVTKSSVQRAIQAVIDNNFRAIVPGRKGLDKLIVMTALKIAKVEDVVVLTDNVTQWKRIAKDEGYVLNENFHIKSIKSIGDHDKKIYKHRSGVLIVSCNNYPWKIRCYAEYLARSFARTVMTAHGIGLTNMKEMANTLSPGCPVDLLEPNRNVFFKHNLSTRGFNTYEPIDLAFLCGIVTDAERFDESEWENGEEFVIDPRWASDASQLDEIEEIEDYEEGTEFLVF